MKLEKKGKTWIKNLGLKQAVTGVYGDDL